jgi:hypothetical protein
LFSNDNVVANTLIVTAVSSLVVAIPACGRHLRSFLLYNWRGC